jgi:hypothetical protein
MMGPALWLATAMAVGASAASHDPVTCPVELVFSELGPLPGEGWPVLVGGDERRLTLPRGVRSELALPAGSRWQVEVDERWWVEAQTLEIPERCGRTTFVLAMGPRGEVSGRLELPPAAPVPVTVEARVWPGGAREKPGPGFLVSCRFDPEERRFACPVPAVPMDLAIKAKSYAANYYWGLEEWGKGRHELPTATLVPGASIAGWLAPELSALALPEGTTVRAVPHLGAGPEPQLVARLGRDGELGAVTASGFFQVRGLGEGPYRLEISAPGYAAVVHGPIQVSAGAESRLRDPIVLERPFALTLRLEPATDWLGASWSVLVGRISEVTGAASDRPLFAGPVPGGAVTIENAAPGRYLVEVLDSRGSHMALEETGLLDRQRAEVLLAVEVIDLVGSVRVGDEVLVGGELTLVPRPRGAHLRYAIDTDGRFHGVLPREGSYRVEVSGGHRAGAGPDESDQARQARGRADRAPAGHGEMPLGHGEERQAEESPRLLDQAGGEVRWTGVVEIAARSGRARLDLVLPDTRLRGRVVERGGRGVAAEVTVSGESGVTVSSDERGRFSVRGFPPGPSKVTAFQPTTKLRSAPLWLAIDEGLAPPEVELVLVPTREVRIQVLGPGGPLRGAAVFVYAPVPAYALYEAARTDGEGIASFRLPDDVVEVTALARAPGFALEAARLALGETPTLHLGMAGGELSWLAEVPEAGAPMLTRNGVGVAIQPLVEWARSQGVAEPMTALRVPNLAPGTYRLCQQDLAAAAAVELRSGAEAAASAGIAVCDEGYLPIGGTLHLHLAGPREDGAR